MDASIDSSDTFSRVEAASVVEMSSPLTYAVNPSAAYF